MTIALVVAEEPAPPDTVDVRCPAPQLRPDGTCHPGRLLLRLRQAGEKPSYVHPDNLIELACEDCKRQLRRSGKQVRRVLHRYDFAGTFVETLLVELAVGLIWHPDLEPFRVDLKWMDKAACKGMTGLFDEPDVQLVVVGGVRQSIARSKAEMARERERLKHARAVCRNCPVLMECRRYSLMRPYLYGIWAGMTRHQRKLLIARVS